MQKIKKQRKSETSAEIWKKELIYELKVLIVIANNCDYYFELLISFEDNTLEITTISTTV